MVKRRAPSPTVVSSPKRSKVKAKDGAGTPDSLLTITPERIRECLDKYPSFISDKLVDLDRKRFEEIPAAVQSRSIGAPVDAVRPASLAQRKGKNAAKPVSQTGDAETAASPTPAGMHLTKAELVSLVEWKLKHGTFRPALLGMARAHPAEFVISTTTEAFALLSRDTPDKESENTMAAFKIITRLKGIGPATASLLLSCADPTVPFFSDELFRWAMWDAPTPGSRQGQGGKGEGWGRGIKYTEKEYKLLLERVRGALQSRQDGLTAMDLEKVAYVLAREAW